MAVYKGFTTRNYETKEKSFILQDVELVKQDLLNHIFTRRATANHVGERVMMPRFGTRIPDMLFEQLDDESLVIIEEDILEVLNYDPRVQIRDFQMTPLYDEKAVIVVADLLYIELDFRDSFDIRIEFE